MIKIPPILLLSFVSFAAFCQPEGHDFQFGMVTVDELRSSTYDRDTSANAVYLNEFGEATAFHTLDMTYLYHAKIKILRKEALDLANFEIPLYKQKATTETIVSLEASSFNLEGGVVKETKIAGKNMFTEDYNKSYSIRKITIPNVKVGSVIEIAYKIKSPFYKRNFHEWEFQGSYPKIRSEFWATIPQELIYNISLIGYLEFGKSESKLITEQWSEAKSTQMEYEMYYIPAFQEEEYMTASSNFSSSIKFELAEVYFSDGTREKLSKSWKSVEEDLAFDEEFGLQLKKAKDIFHPYIDTLIADEKDQAGKAKKIYDFIKARYAWNEINGFYTRQGLKTAFEQRKGNVGEINLSLIAALRDAEFDAHPVLVSTRRNGLPSALYPVVTDFNYVVARVKVGENYHLLDATEDYYPFGLIPERCLNGRGRALGPDSSQWVPLNAAQRDKHVTMLKMNLDESGMIKGNITTTFSGYAAVEVRKELNSVANETEYFTKLLKDLVGYEIGKTSIENFKNIYSPLVQNIEFTFNAFEGGQSTCLFNPFPIERWTRNPFRSSERLYPVDFGAPLEEVFMVEFTYPPNVEVSSLPEKTAVALPGNGGRLIVDPKPGENKLSLSVFLSITKPVFTSEEYHYLKELFAKVVQIHQTDLLIQKKTKG